MLDFTTLEIIRYYAKEIGIIVLIVYVVVFFILFGVYVSDFRDEIINTIAGGMLLFHMFITSTILFCIPAVSYTHLTLPTNREM